MLKHYLTINPRYVSGDLYRFYAINFTPDYFLPNIQSISHVVQYFNRAFWRLIRVKNSNRKISRSHLFTYRSVVCY